MTEEERENAYSDEWLGAPAEEFEKKAETLLTSLVKSDAFIVNPDSGQVVINNSKVIDFVLNDDMLNERQKALFIYKIGALPYIMWVASIRQRAPERFLSQN